MRTYYYRDEDDVSGACINTYETEEDEEGNYFYPNEEQTTSTWVHNTHAYTQSYLRGSAYWQRISRCKARKLFRKWGVENVFDNAYCRSQAQ